ncbi:hypothetical protein Tco_0860652 [Tanacetum coccineum]|uniref:Transposase (putative) gypsy type domain-containing protein n=1 Tax=Tanacetum coccineum TaxID=301880 RepID=A0ABQ5BFJ6_9ASTR
MHTVRGDGVAGIKRRRRDLSGDGVRNLATASGRGRLKEDLESSTWRRRIGVSTESDDTMNEDTSVGVASPVKEGVTPSVVDMMVEKEKICPLEDTIVLEFFPTLTMLVTTMAGNAPALTGLTLSFSSMDGLDAMHEKWTLGRAIIHVMSVLSMSGNLLGVRLVKVFGHIHEECPKNTGAGEKKTVKKPSHILSVSVGENESEDEIASVYNDMARSMANEKVGFGTQSLLEQRKDSYGNGDYDDDPIAKRYVQKVVYTPSFVIFDNLSPPVSLKMSEEDQNAGVVPLVKSDMHSYSSTMTAKDVKALAFKHNIPLDLHPVALTAEWTMDKLTDDFIGLYEQYFEFSGVRVPFSTLLLAALDHFRVHISQLVPIGLTRLTLFELYCRSLHIVPSVNLFRVFYKIGKQGDWFTFERRVGPGSGGKILNETFSGLKGWKKRLATTWEFSGFLPVCKDTEGNVVTMFLSIYNASLPGGCYYVDMTARLKEVEIPDPKIVVIRERKARAAAKKRAERKRAAGGEGGSKGKTKRRKVSAIRAEEEDSTEEASSASPLRTVAPNPSFLLKDVDDVGTAESREDEHVSVPRHDSANTSAHNYAADHDESFDESRGHGETAETHPADETRLTETPVPARNPEKMAVQDLVPVVRSNLADPADGAESSRPGSVYVPEWTIHRRFLLLVFSDWVSNERAVENERLVSKLGPGGPKAYCNRLRGPYGLYCGRSKVLILTSDTRMLSSMTVYLRPIPFVEKRFPVFQSARPGAPEVCQAEGSLAIALP